MTIRVGGFTGHVLAGGAGLLLTFCSVDKKERSFGSERGGAAGQSTSGGETTSGGRASAGGGTNPRLLGGKPGEAGASGEATSGGAIGGIGEDEKNDGQGGSDADPGSNQGGAAGSGGEVPTSRIRQLAVSGLNACAVIADGTVKCWGENDGQRLIEGAPQKISTPTSISNLSGVQRLAMSQSDWCALLQNGSARCWGSNEHAQLGLGHEMPVKSPSSADSLRFIEQVSLNSWNACFVMTDKSVSCSGDAANLGIKSADSLATPMRVSSLPTIAQIELGNTHQCALLMNGSVACWGYDIYGVFGAYDMMPDAFREPVLMSGVTKARQISAGSYHTCALRDDATVVCWGNNGYGQLGSGNKQPIAGPVTVVSVISSSQPTLQDVAQVAAGYQHTCALLADGTVSCWGRNESGELGDGTNTGSSWPVRVKGLENVVQIASNHSASLSCALLRDDAVKCWGGGDSTPVTVSVL